MKAAVYLRPDQWALIDALLSSSADTMASEAETGRGLLQPASRVGLRWCATHISEIREEIANALLKKEKNSDA